MKTYTKFLIIEFLKSFLNIFLVMLSLVFILNILKEIEFFNNVNVSSFFPLYVSTLSTPSIIFEMFPFIFLVSTQFFFIKLFNNNEIQIFKYSGLKNIKLLQIICFVGIILGFLIISVFYNTSSSLQNYYLQVKNKYSEDKVYLAVINKNGLWIKDIIKEKTVIINSSKIEGNFLTDSFITIFDKNFNPIKSLRSNKIDIKNNKWLVYDATVFENNTSKKFDLIEFNSNFNQKRIESLFSNLSSLSLIKLINLKKNYESLNYSVVDVNIQIYKILTYPLYLILMIILSAIIMFNTKQFKSNTFKIIVGLFFSVIIYYLNNFFNVMGSSEKIPLFVAIWFPLIFLTIANSIFLLKINEK